ncbi:proton-conducting transporter membrane subunit [Cryobacterium sp. Hh38]|uniref:proton-conducting transporter transmembrane domain-containing protein n=1 Tax=Cryobacterium sp. Hh38 TaxID=1259156 RepID=UPI00106D2D37|nr:proton-conducting transporter membrane subunit [Cryobacterium sp. Hh38]TFD56154.1 NADH-quinone oxidoreductase subunit L [Cryobacterium sp. Hh38]
MSAAAVSALGVTALWLLVSLPALAGIALCVTGRRANLAAVPVSLGTAGLTVAMAFVVASVRPSVEVPFVAGARFGLAVDGLSAVIVPTVAVITLMVLVFAAAEGTESPARFHGLMLIFAAAVAVTATATTLPTLLFAWEIMGAMSYALIGFRWREDNRVGAGLTAFITTRFGDLGLYLAAGAALAGGAGLGLADLTAAPSPWRHIIAAGILMAAFGKAAQLPFSFWLSRAMEGPSPVSALLHSAAMVAMGGYLLLRLAPLLEVTGWAATTTAWVGALTALLLGAVAVAQQDLKQLLAASTAAQLGFVVLAAGVGSVAGGTTHLIAHASTKALLFLAAGAWLAALGTKQLPALRGAARRWPLVGVTFAVGGLSLAGIAPLALWATKDQLLAGALETSPALYVVGLAAAALAAAYTGKALIIVWSHPLTNARDEYDTEQSGTRHIGAWERVPLTVLAAGAALLGVLALPPVGDWVRGVLGAESDPRPGPLELVGSAVLALLVLGLVAWKRTPQPSWAANWLGLERATRVVVVDPVLLVSQRLAHFDDAVLDRGIHTAARTALRGARRLGWFDDHGLDAAVTAAARGSIVTASAAARADTDGVDAAVTAIASTARRFGMIARRPQTGLLHQYYAQITVVLAVAVILLLVLPVVR